MAGRTGGISYADSSLIDELLHAIELDPPNVEAKKLLAEQWQTLGWDEAAADLADEILAVQPRDREAQFIRDSARRGGLEHDQTAKTDAPPAYSAFISDGPVADDVHTTRQLKDAYKTLRDEARSLLHELLCFKQVAPSADCTEHVNDLTALSEGRMFSVARRTVTQPSAGPSKAPIGCPPTVKVLASSMKVDANTAVDTAIVDFTNALEWERHRKTKRNGDNADAARDAVRKRADALKVVLPSKMAHMAFEAFMHLEHEILQKAYVNPTTMIMGDPIADIPRSDFWASEDGYAWDMTELVQAIEVNGGAMRNPLSKENFTVSDVEAIIRHPHGKKLAAMQVEQNKLSKGVRKETITRMRDLATIVLDDQSVNSHPSHDAVDSFLTYMATLPTNEREALDKLRVPAVDSHTRQKFDMTIGDAVRDAKSNQICFHKAGDLLNQGATWLSKNKS